MLRLEIVTPERRVLDETVESVTVPTASGEAGILTNHAPLVSALKPGILSYSAKGATERIAIAGGFLEVNSNKVSVLTDAAEAATEIDVERVRRERESAERELSAASTLPVEETDPIRERIEESDAKLQLASGR
jgi:F-type H+-transporting ATPase subunit epsilon